MSDSATDFDPDDLDAPFKPWSEMTFDERAEMEREYETAEVYSFSASFYAIRHVEETRKPHECQRCKAVFPSGTRAWCGTMDVQGRPVTVYLCASCPWPADKPFTRRDPLSEQRARVRAKRRRGKMTTERQIERARAQELHAAPAEDTVRAFLATHSARTRVEYAKALVYFSDHLETGGIGETAARLLGGRAGEANRAVLDWRNAMIAAGLSAATVNMRISAVKSLVKFARMLGVVEWTLEVPSAKAAPVEDRRGPSEAEYARLLAACRDAQDVAVLRLLCDRGLRRAEVASLRMQDWTDEGGDLGVIKPLRKGQTVRERLTIHGPTLAAVRAHVEARTAEHPWMFSTRRGAPAEGWSIYEDMQAVGRRAGVRFRPHAGRHRAITRVLERNGGNVAKAARFAGHANVNVTMRYEDDRTDAAQEMARLVVEE